MDCKHEQIGCRDNVFFCLKCGSALPSPFKAGKDPSEAEKPAKAPKRAAKRTTKKKGE